jgi:hypothetical protein
MYIHIYTTATSEKELHIWWLVVPDKSLALAFDFERLLQKYREFGCISSYTGEVFEVKTVKAFEEHLILMGVSTSGSTLLGLQDGSKLTLNYGVTRLMDQFNELYSICFASYDMAYAFSSDSSRTAHNHDEPLLRVEVFNTIIYTPRIKLDYIAYNTLLLETDNRVLNSWFSQFNKTSCATTYTSMCSILEKLYNRQLVENEIESSKSQETTFESRSEDTVWIEEFCNLYAEKDEKVNTLISDVYQQYLTASSWTNTDTVSMSVFSRHLKTISKFTIKRTAKGMVIAGYRFLVSQQEEFYKKKKEGNLFERTLLTFIDTDFIKTSNTGTALSELYTPINIKENYYYEAILLLGGRNQSNKLPKVMLDQFINNPFIKKSIILYSEYIKEVMADESINNSMDRYREFASTVVFYFPFAKKLYEALSQHLFGCTFFNELQSSNTTYPFDPNYCTFETYT